MSTESNEQRVHQSSDQQSSNRLPVEISLFRTQAFCHKNLSNSGGRHAERAKPGPAIAIPTASKIRFAPLF
jgi:hypothetical protein